jgi:hypothetical protein
MSRTVSFDGKYVLKKVKGGIVPGTIPPFCFRSRLNQGIAKGAISFFGCASILARKGDD